jgi:preprotein translocase subunit YajC
MHIAAKAIIFAATSSTKPTTNSTGSLIFFVVIFGLLFVVWRRFMKPRQRAAQSQRDTLMTLEPGDEVLTGAGIFGTVQHVHGDRVTLWTGTGSTITVLKRTIVRKVDEDDPDYVSDEHDPDEHDSWDDDDTAALNAHQDADEADEHDDAPEVDHAADASQTPAQPGTNAKPPTTADVGGDGHLADRIDELTAPERPSEDEDR